MDTNTSALFKEAMRLYNTGARRKAAGFCQQILAQDNEQTDALHMLGFILCEEGNLETGLGLLQKALAQDPSHTGILYNLGRALLDAQEHESAILHLEKAARINPHNPHLHATLGAAYQRREDIESLGKALQCLETASRLAPGNSHMQSAKADTLAALGRIDEAIKLYQSALQLDERNLAALGNLAAIYERTNKLGELKKLIESGLAKSPFHPVLRYNLAILLRREKKYAAALEVLDKLTKEKITDFLRKNVEFEMATILDKCKRYEEAYRHSKEANAINARLDKKPEAGSIPYRTWLDNVYGYFSKQWLEQKPVSRHQPHPELVFIFSFPRSGTTLIDTILDSHDKFQVIEEKPFLENLFNKLEKEGYRYPDNYENLPDELVAELQSIYFNTVDKYIARKPGTILVDKNPLLTPYIPFYYRIFPSAKYIFAARHPLDVCLSCQMFNFRPHTALADYIEVEEIARDYARVLKLWKLIKQYVPLDAYEIRYEDIVDDMDGETRKLLAFLGYQWSEKIKSFGKHAARHRQIIMPNHDRIVEGLYKDSKYRWKNYSAQVAAAIPHLSEALEYFGYTAE